MTGWDNMEHTLTIVTYHYVRDLPRTKFPRIKGMLIDEFASQVRCFCERFEMATLESALAYLKGEYRPRRDLCLLTFDDGLKDHYTNVLPILADRKIQGLFFLSTAGVENRSVASVHKNHFLMAALDFKEYAAAFRNEMTEAQHKIAENIDAGQAARTYRWDTPEVGAFKYLLNFRMTEPERNKILGKLFRNQFGDEEAFARELYLSWEESRQMQRDGMIIGGHSHNHVALATLSDDEQAADLRTCAALLRSRLLAQPLWPFSYPYGKTASFNATTLTLLRELDFACGFATEMGVNPPGQDLFLLRRNDPKDPRPQP